MNRDRPVLRSLMLWKQRAVFCYGVSQVGKIHGKIRDDNWAEVTEVNCFQTLLRLL